MYSYLLIVFATLISFGQTKTVDGPCPIAVKEIKTLDINRYLGKWYDVHLDPNRWECPRVLNCTLAYYRAYNEEKHVFIVNYYYFDGPYNAICAYGLYQKDFDVDAKLFDDSHDNTVYLLDTDYDNYAIEVGCFGDKNAKTHEEKVVIRSRTKSMDNDLLEQLKKKVVDFGFAEPDLIAQDYSQCEDYEPW